MGKVKLRRYTNLAATIYILRNQTITLLDPALWDDRNDAYFVDQYKRQKSAKSVLALCFAKGPETYHHWKVFSHGLDGVSLEFEKAKLLSAFKNDPRVRSNSVTYKNIKEVRRSHPNVEELPFLKRIHYQDEREFRIIYVDCDKNVEVKDYEIGLDSTLGVKLSPWMPPSLSKAVKATIHSIPGCENLKITRSTLIESGRWKGVADA